MSYQDFSNAILLFLARSRENPDGFYCRADARNFSGAGTVADNLRFGWDDWAWAR